MEVAIRSWFRSRQGGPTGPILALDTSTDRAAVALEGMDQACHVAAPGESRRHGRGLLPTIRNLLRRADIQPDDLAAIGVGLGPGSFTGLRIGLTAAKTLAYALDCPLYGLDSLEAIARNAPDQVLRVVAVADAQRGDLFVADFVRTLPGGPLQGRGGSRIESIVALLARLEPGTYVVGPPLGRNEPAWPVSIVRNEPETGYPDGPRMLELTRERIAEGGRLDPWFLEPTYVRRSAAEEKGTTA
jgi:tRNA threonylcarbamoyladenosine biosynthesis protein TsaB